MDNLVHVAATWTGGVILVALLHLLERVTSRHIAHHLGWRGVLITGWLGVPVHELSHLAAARLFGHRIIAWKLFDPDPVTGTLGYVRHAYNRRNAWQLLGGFFIAVAPLAAGAAGLAAIVCWMAPAAAWATLPSALAPGAGSTALAVVGAFHRGGAVVWGHRSPLLPLQLYLAVCLASHMAPSRADLSGGLSGGLLALVLTAGGAMLAGHMGHHLTQGTLALALLLQLLLASALFQGTYAAAAGLAARIARRRSRHHAR